MVSEKNMPLLRRNDVMLASFPRSGNTWVMNLLLYLGILVLEGYVHDLGIDHAADFPDEPSEYIPALKNLKSILRNEKALFRVVKTHELYNPSFNKSIYIIRDGRDAVISYYYYFKRFNNFNGTFFDFLNISPSPANQWAKHVESWLADKQSIILFVRYEDLKKDTVKEVKAILDFLGEIRSLSEIQAGVSECCFDKLSKHELNVKSPPSSDPNLSFFRKGIVGDWKNVFEPEHILKFKQEANETLLRLGYEDSPDW